MWLCFMLSVRRPSETGWDKWRSESDWANIKLTCGWLKTQLNSHRPHPGWFALRCSSNTFLDDDDGNNQNLITNLAAKEPVTCESCESSGVWDSYANNSFFIEFCASPAKDELFALGSSVKGRPERAGGANQIFIVLGQGSGDGGKYQSPAGLFLRSLADLVFHFARLRN